MYKKIMFILLTLLFMSGSCDLDGDKPNAISKKAQTVSPTNNQATNNPIPIDTTTISLVDNKHDGVIKFDNIKFIAKVKKGNKLISKDRQVKSVLISTTDAALKAANITKLSEAKNMREKDKLRELVKSLTFTIKAVTSPPEDELTIKSDYKNLKIIYEGLKDYEGNRPSLKTMLNINGVDVELKNTLFKPQMIFAFQSASQEWEILVSEKDRSSMIIFLGDVLGITGPGNLREYLP